MGSPNQEIRWRLSRQIHLYFHQERQTQGKKNVEKILFSTAVILSLDNCFCKFPSFLISNANNDFFCHICWNPLVTYFLLPWTATPEVQPSQDIKDFMEIFKTSVFLSSLLESMCQGLHSRRL